MQKKKKIICFMGKSGSGKSTEIKWLHRDFPETHIVKSFTTREIRVDDPEDIYTHTFVTEKEFENDKKNNEIIALYESPKGYKSWTTDKSFKNINLYAIDPKAYIELYKSNKYDMLGIYLNLDEVTRADRLRKRDKVEKIDIENHLDKKILLESDVPFLIINEYATHRIEKIVGNFIGKHF